MKNNIKNMEEAAVSYFKSALKFYEELQLNDGPADSEIWNETSKRLNKIQDLISSADDYVREATVRLQVQTHINHHYRNRIYLVRRKINQVKKPLTWVEISGHSEGPWNAGNFLLLNVAKRDRDHKNKIENSERPNVRGWKPGSFVWELWAYNPGQDTWEYVE